jgi:hypothetical protein
MMSAMGIVRPTVTMPPRAFPERVDDDQGEHRDQHDHDSQHGHQRGEACDGADFLLRHLAERLAVAADRRAEDDKVLDGAAECHADDDPDGAGQETELRGEGWTNERPGAGNGGEVVTEYDPAIGRHEIATVVEAFGRRRASGVQREHVGRDDPAVKPVGDHVRADGRDEQPGGAQMLPTSEGHDAKRRRRRRGRPGSRPESKEDAASGWATLGCWKRVPGWRHWPGWRRLQNMDYGPQSVNADSGRVRTLGLWRIRAADIVLAALLNVQPTGPPVMTRTRRVLTISLCLTTFAIGCVRESTHSFGEFVDRYLDDFARRHPSIAAGERASPARRPAG